MTAKQLKGFKRAGRPLIGSSPRVAISVRIEEEVQYPMSLRFQKPVVTE